MKYDILLERVAHPPIKKLPKLEKAFANLALSTKENQEESIKKIEQILTNITDGCKVVVELARGGIWYDNCCVTALPKKEFIKDIGKFKKDSISIKNIESLIITIGLGLFKIMSPSEMVAIILHELGHWNVHFNSTSSVLLHLFRFILHTINVGGFIAIVITHQIAPIIYVMFLMIFLASNTINYFSQKVEYECDEIAVKYGYGDDLYSAFQKMKILRSKYKSEPAVIIFLRQIKDLFFGVTHPELEDRMTRITEHIKTKYKDLYNLPKHKKLIKEYYNISV